MKMKHGHLNRIFNNGQLLRCFQQMYILTIYDHWIQKKLQLIQFFFDISSKVFRFFWRFFIRFFLYKSVIFIRITDSWIFFLFTFRF